MNFQAGYRDGIGAGQQSTVQAGFDEGYSQKGVPLGREVGHLRGISASLLAYLASDAFPATRISQDERTEYTERTRELVRRLGKFRVADLAGPDLEAEQHAREHGEDVVIPQEVQDQRDMDSLEDSLAGMNGAGSSAVASKGDTKTPYQELQECKEDLKELLKRCGLEDILG